MKSHLAVLLMIWRNFRIGLSWRCNEEIVGDIEFDDENINFPKLMIKLSFEGKINLKDFIE
jgi:hypothetical protein